ncbi:Olfactory Receptor 7G1 [Manis pentadactyla]|nr:Olfactory Receptor 7G1 [Manis pentadactyla]
MEAAAAATLFIKNMNHTDVSEFLLLGLTDNPNLQPFLFGLFLSMYLVIILGNLLIILAVSSDPHLHTPITGNALLHSLMVLRLSFCRDLEIPDFCEHAQVIKLACSDTLINNFLEQSVYLDGCHDLLCATSWVEVDISYKKWKNFRFINNMNHTDVPEFLLLGLTDDPELQPFLLGLFLSMYLVTILGILLIILAISSDPHLHTPIYSFLCIQSLADICISTTTIPKMLVNIQTQNQHISYTGCIAQIGFVLFFGGFENCLLAAMAYECGHLPSTEVHSHHDPPTLLLSVLLSITDALLHSLMVLRLFFCTNREIPHFFCELDQVFKLACSDTLINNFLIYFVGSLFGGVPVSVIIFSYTLILSSILRMPSVEGLTDADILLHHLQDNIILLVK